MLCHICGKNTPAIHIKTIVGGELSEFSICASCAYKMGYGVLPDLSGGFLPPPTAERCPLCGQSFEELARTGRAGCAQCYETFYSRLMPALQKLYGGAVYHGKTPGMSLPQVREAPTLTLIRRRLREAIDAENFEDAAALRDQIRDLESGAVQ